MTAQATVGEVQTLLVRGTFRSDTKLALAVSGDAGCHDMKEHVL
jgi:hypothetical protein